MTLRSAWALGVLTPFVVLFGTALVTLTIRWIRRTINRAKPKHFDRRINIAAGIVGARRAYVLGGNRHFFALVLSRRYHREDQARAFLLDGFAPETSESTKTST